MGHRVFHPVYYVLVMSEGQIIGLVWTYFSKNTCEGLYSPSQRGHTFPVWIYWRRDSIVIISLLIYTTIIIVKRVALDSDISDIGDVNKKYFLQNIYYKYL